MSDRDSGDEQQAAGPGKLFKHILSFFVKVPEIKAASNNLTDACYDENGQLHGLDLFIRTDVRTEFVSIEENLEGGK